MEPEDKKMFLTIISGLAEEFGGKASKDNIKIRFEALKEYPIEKISKACTWLLKNREKTFPAIPRTKEIIEAIERIEGNLDQKNKAELEADKVFNKLKMYGRAAEPLFLDETTKYLMTHRWSFEQLGNMTEPDLKWWRKDFIEANQETDKQKDLVLDTAERAGMIPADNLKKLTTAKKI